MGGYLMLIDQFWDEMKVGYEKRVALGAHAEEMLLGEAFRISSH